MARALKAGTLVKGSVEKESDRIRVTVRLIDGGSGADFQRASFERPATDILAIQDSLVQEVASLIRQRLGEEIKVREQREGTTSPDAWILVQRAEQARKAAEALVAAQDTTGAVAARFTEADSSYALAQRLDPSWVEPVLGRGWIAFRRSRLVGLDPIAAKPWIDQGKEFAEQALALGPQHPEALQLRGELRYWSWLLTMEPDPVKAEQLLKDAQTDLETAVKVRPSQAGAWAALSHLYYQTGGETDAKLAARRAYEEDAYLNNADVILDAPLPRLVRPEPVRGRRPLVRRRPAALSRRFQVRQVSALDVDAPGRKSPTLTSPGSWPTVSGRSRPHRGAPSRRSRPEC